jgi:hypothetical protein
MGALEIKDFLRIYKGCGRIYKRGEKTEKVDSGFLIPSCFLSPPILSPPILSSPRLQGFLVLPGV